MEQRRWFRRDHRTRKVLPSKICYSHQTHLKISCFLCASIAKCTISNKFSGRKIIKILEKNPKKDDKKYDEDDLPHMRKVVSYCKRHLAQEEKAKKDHSSKSYKSYVCLVTDLHSSVH